MSELTALIKKAILENGGLDSDIKFFNQETMKKMIQNYGKQLAIKGIKSRTPNPAFPVKPVTVKGIKKYLNWMFNLIYVWITTGHCQLKPVVDELKIIELIKLTPGLDTEAALKEIDELGFEPAPSNYLLGLEKQHRNINKRYKYIISLDKKYLSSNDGFLSLVYEGKYFITYEVGWGGEDNGVCQWFDNWWFAVIRKQSLKS